MSSEVQATRRDGDPLFRDVDTSADPSLVAMMDATDTWPAVRAARRADSSSTGSGRCASKSTSVDSTSVSTLPTAMPNILVPSLFIPLAIVMAGLTAVVLPSRSNYTTHEAWLEAARKAAEAGEITERSLAAHLYTADLPPLDLLIRTSGEVRLSNFLLWQAAYAEMLFLDVLWPDFTPEHLAEALDNFATRERRYGGR